MKYSEKLTKKICNIGSKKSASLIQMLYKLASNIEAGYFEQRLIRKLLNNKELVINTFNSNEKVKCIFFYFDQPDVWGYAVATSFSEEEIIRLINLMVFA